MAGKLIIPGANTQANNGGDLSIEYNDALEGDDLKAANKAVKAVLEGGSFATMEAAAEAVRKVEGVLRVEIK